MDPGEREEREGVGVKKMLIFILELLHYFFLPRLIFLN